MKMLNRKNIWLGIGGIFLLIVLGSMLGFWLYASLWLGIDMNKQQGYVKLPSSFRANIAATNTFNVQLNGTVDARLPIDQVIDIPLKGNYAGHVELNTPIALNFKVRYQGVIPINSFADIESITALVMPKLPELPLKLRVPLQFDIPVDMVIPVNTSIRFAYQGPVVLGFDQVIQAPVQENLKIKVPIDRPMQVPLVTSFDLLTYAGQKPLAMHLSSFIQQPLNQLKLIPLHNDQQINFRVETQ